MAECATLPFMPGEDQKSGWSTAADYSGRSGLYELPCELLGALVLSNMAQSTAAICRAG